MIAERTGDALIYSKDKEMIEEMDGETAKVIEGFLQAVDIEALRLAKRSGQYSLSQYSARPFSHCASRLRCVNRRDLIAYVALCRARASTQPA